MCQGICNCASYIGEKTERRLQGLPPKVRNSKPSETHIPGMVHEDQHDAGRRTFRPDLGASRCVRALVARLMVDFLGGFATR